MLNGYRIALVEDDEIMGSSLTQRLELEGAEVIWLRQMQRAIGALRTPSGRLDAVICDIRLPDGTGEELYDILCETASPPPFLFITGHGGIEQAVRLMQSGAADYVTKPFEIGVFLERLALLMAPQAEPEFPPVLGVSPAARRVEELAVKAAEDDQPVLIRGRAGTGKGLVARRIHELSDRRAAPFVQVNLAREPDAETALFGPGGAWEGVGEGTLFLHALGHMSARVQQRFGQALEGGFGGRIVASCGDGFAKVLADGGFLPDLYFRLNMREIVIPPLTERTEDAVWLLHRLFVQMKDERASPLEGMSRLCDEAVRVHEWRGDGRELRYRLQRAFENAPGPLIQPADLFPEKIAEGGPFLTLSEAREQAEHEQIVKALARTGGRVVEAARLLKVSRTTLWEKMQKFGITPKPE